MSLLSGYWGPAYSRGEAGGAHVPMGGAALQAPALFERSEPGCSTTGTRESAAQPSCAVVLR